MASIDTFGTKRTLVVGGKKYSYFSLTALEQKLNKNLSRLPFSLRILLENLLRLEDGRVVKTDDIESLVIGILKQFPIRKYHLCLRVSSYRILPVFPLLLTLR